MKRAALRRALTDRAALVVFGILAVTWFFPQVVAPLDSPLLLGVAQVLVVPAYLLSLLVFDGLLEAAVYPVADALPVVRPFVWEAGLLVVFYAFAVLAAWLGRRLAARAAPFRPGTGDGPQYVLAGVLVAFGVVLLASGFALALTSPTVTVHSCTGTGTSAETSTGSSGGAVSEECRTETRPNTVPYWALGGGAAVGLLGGAVVAGDVALARRRATG